MIAMAGSVESCDCLVMLFKSEKTEIDLKSDVIIQYGDQIKSVIVQTLEKYNISNIKVSIEDKGALDYTIKARLESALKRGGLI
ncbi:MAG: citrate lyase acyl carrier protein [Bacilli bacterium]